MIADSLQGGRGLTTRSRSTASTARRGSGAPSSRATRSPSLILQHESPLDAGITGWVIRRTPRRSSRTTPTSTRGPCRSPAPPRSPSRCLVCPLLVCGRGHRHAQRRPARRHGKRTSAATSSSWPSCSRRRRRSRSGTPEAHGGVRARRRPRRADRPPQPRRLPARARVGSSERGGAVRPRSCSTSTRSRPTTTPMAIPRATRSWSGSRPGMREAIREDDRPYRYGGDELRDPAPGRGAAPGPARSRSRCGAAIGRR